MRLKAVPTVAFAGVMTLKCVGEPAEATAIDFETPVIDAVAESVAVIV